MNQSNSKTTQPFRHRIALAIDVLMIILVIMDLSFIAFDSLFNVRFIREGILGALLPQFKDWYAETIHEDFLLYEIIFPILFIIEITIRWFLAIIRKTYAKWFFYPFIHWYDVLGCLPISSLRLLRFVRLVVLTYRLHRWGVINLNNYALFRYGLHYYNIAVEEISDRVAVSLLTQARDEVKRGVPMSEDIINKVLEPRREQIVGWAAGRVQEGLRRHYLANRPEIQTYLQDIIRESVDNNQELRNLEKIPVIGGQIANAINKSVQDITFNVIDHLTSDFAASENREMLEAVVDAITEVILSKGHSTETSAEFTNQLVIESMDLMIERVRSKKWQLMEQKMDEDPDDVFY
jgi:hypothetical protein